MAKSYMTYGRELNLFRSVANAIPDALDEIIGFVMKDQVKPLAVQLCPKRSRRLSKTIRVIRVRKLLWKLMAGQMTVDGVFVNYERWVEGGTHNSPAQPFMAPAMQSGRGWLLAELRNFESYVRKYMTAA
jgi:hypothetical protein